VTEFRLAVVCAAGAFVSVITGGCRQNAPAETQRVVSALNASPRTSDFVIEATNSVRLQTGGMVVNGGDIGARGSGSGPFLGDGAAVDALTGVQVQTTHNVIADSVNLGTGAAVGDVQTNHLTSGTGASHGAVSGLVSLPAIPTAATVSAGTTAINVTTGATVSSTPGHYGAVTVGTGSTWKVAAGSYDIASLTMSSSAKLQALGAVQIHIAGRVSTTSGAIVGPASGVTLTASGIRIEVSGINGTSGALTATPPAASFGTGNHVNALVLVPNGTLAFGTGAVATGAFMGRDVDVAGSGTQFVFQDGFPNAQTCTAQSCDDSNPCTVDTCNANGTCTHAPAAPGTSCSDGNACNGAETCDGAGACKAGTPITCTAQDQCHVAGTCDPGTGACTNPAAANGTSCNDGDACTLTDTCQAGVCKGTAITCTAQDQCHAAGTCDKTTGLCSNPAKADGTSCNDGNACTLTDTCQAGLCQGGNSVTCVASDQCHGPGMCDPTTGLCSNPAVADGTACNDGNACTQTDSCQAGLCQGGSPVTCVASDQCHAAGTCDPSNGKCSNPSAPDGTTCNDGNACTTGDVCHTGVCSGAGVTCVAQDQCHAAGTCDPSNGKCSNPAKGDGTSCDDGNACTTGDSCHAGACVAGTNACPTLAIAQFPTINQVFPDLQANLSTPTTAAVPGDPVTFNFEINYADAFMRASANMRVTNDGTQTFTWSSYQVTMSYLSALTQQWVPIAGTSFDASGNQSDVPQLLHLNFGNYVGSTIQAGQYVDYDSTENVTLPGTMIAMLGDPAQVTSVRVELHLDTGTPPGVTSDRDITDSFTNGVTTTTNRTAHVAIQGPFVTNGISLGAADVPPGATVALTGSMPAPLTPPRDPSESDAQYLARLVNVQYSAVQLDYGYTGIGRVNFALLAPALSAQKSGPQQGPAGFVLPYTVQLQNLGAAAASSIQVTDTVNGQDVNAQVSAPASVAPVATATATINAGSPISQTPGPYTDVATVTWKDANGNAYGPVSSSFTTSLTSAYPEGYLTLVASGGAMEILGSTITLTATALDQFGTPVASQPISLAIAGSNAQTIPLVTGPDGTASFSYSGANLGTDTATVTATVNGRTLTASASAVVWAADVGAPCASRSTPLDVMMLIDDSPSMFSPDTVAAAKAATATFIGNLDPTRDQVGGSVFMGDAGLDAPLTSNFASATSAINTQIQYFVDLCSGFCGGGTGYFNAFQVAVTELQGPRHRSSASPVIVLLSDGGNTGVDYTAEVAAAKAAGIRVVTLGFGSNVNAVAMRAIASSPNDYFYAPTASELGWTYSNIVQDTCRTVPPLVSAGGDQGLYEVRLPNSVTLNGEVHGQGPRGDLGLTATWTQVSGPAPVTFTDASSPVTDAVFTDPGTYILQLEASDGFMITASRATITVDPAQSLQGANLAVAVASPGPLTLGAPEVVTATLTDSLAQPIASYAVQLTITGANAGTALMLTNAYGVATFTYAGTNVGADVLHVTALGPASQLDSSPLSVQWMAPVGEGPIATQGWIGAPAQQSTLMGLVPIKVAAGVTVASGTVAYWPAKSPDDVHVLTQNASGGPGATLATFDTTTLANGAYIIDLDGIDAGGQAKQSAVLVTVSGDYKPGRVVMDVPEFTVPVIGIPIAISRRYDSLTKDQVGDFGNGWSLTMGHPDLQVDPANNVTITMPNGRRVTFRFALQPLVLNGGSIALIFEFLGRPVYLPEPGVFGSLTADGCDILTFNPDDPDPVCFGAVTASDVRYSPTTYKYTDAYGTVSTMGADGTLKSIQDRNQNVLTFSATGITSSVTGQTVAFTRDDQNRITKIVTPTLGDFLNTHFEYDYAYDANGNLSTADRAPIDGSLNRYSYTYDSDHRLLTTTDPLGHAARTSTYDAAGRLVTDTDALNNVTHYAYDLAGHTTTTTYPDTGVRSQVFDDRGLLLSETDQLARTTTHVYDANWNETKRTNALGESTTYTYDSNGNQTSATNALGEVTTTAYNEFAEPVTRTNVIGNTASIVYDSTGLPVSVTDSTGPLASFTSSEHGLPTSVTDAAGNSVFLNYDGAGNVTARTDRLGRQTTYTYDPLGRQLTKHTPRGGVWTYGYDQRNELTSINDPVNDIYGTRRLLHDNNGNLVADYFPFFGHSFGYTFDALNHLTQTQFWGGTTTEASYDFRGSKLSDTDESGHVTTYTYDLAGQLTQTTYADGTFTLQSYDALGRLASKTDERGNTMTYGYEAGCDCSERLTSVTDPLGRTTAMTYDGMGRKTSTTDAAGHKVSYVYDLRGHLIETDYPDGTATHETYDAVGRRTASTDQTNATTHYGYDAEGQLTSVTDPLGNVTHYAYDDDGNLASVTDANGHITSYAYDLMDEKVSRTLPLGMTESFTYDPVQELVTHTDFRGKTTSFTYDFRKRLQTKVPDPTLGEPTITYNYNPDGTRASMVDASGTTTYTYDLRDRLLTKARPEGTLTYTYDASGNVASIDSSNANGTSVAYAWDAANQLVSVTDNRLGGMTTAAYTATGRPSTLTEPNGVGVTYAYDSLDRVLSMAWRKGSAAPVASWTYSYSPRGQRLTATELSGREATYGYDTASRLTTEAITGNSAGASANGTLTYVLDSAGNRLSRTSTLAALGPQSFSYDPNDELKSETYDLNGNTTSSGGHTYAYDFESRLVSKDAGAVTIVYDGDGNRVAKTAAGVITTYLVDDLNPTGYLQVMEEVSAGAVQVRYTYGNVLASQSRNASGTFAPSFYGYDAHGNIAFLTDATGTETDRYIYDAWGNLIDRTGDTSNVRLYAGEEFDPDLGIMNLRARQYVAGIGRFLTVDPVPVERRDRTASNGFSYAGVDPVNRRDPSGLLDLIEDATDLSRDLELIARSEATFLKATAAVFAVGYIATKAEYTYLNTIASTAGMYYGLTAALLSTKSPFVGGFAAFPGTVGIGVTLGCGIGFLAAAMDGIDVENTKASLFPYCLTVGFPIP
jgi:RHS repeat-associated protein